MAFLIECTLSNYEVRGVDSGTSKKGNSFRSLRVESSSGRTAEISVTKPEFFTDVDRLKKGDLISCEVMAVAGKDRSYLSMLTAPVVMGNSYSATSGVDF